jgi:lipopolysaccharide export system permease protein
MLRSIKKNQEGPYMKIWQRYLLSKLVTLFVFILLSILAIYLLIDLSTNGVKFTKGSSLGVCIYYVQSFSSLMNLFIPLAFMLASLKVLFDLTSHFEILSLEMAGLSKKKILTPFFIFALLLSSISYVNQQWIGPKSIASVEAFKMVHTSKKKNESKKEVLFQTLPDDSDLVYHQFDSEKKELHDVFWIRSPTDIWHMKSLILSTTPPTAFHVDHLENENGRLTKKESFACKEFPTLTISPNRTTLASVGSRSLSTLYNQRASGAEIQTHLHNKLAVPLLPIFILMAIAPFALSHSRDRPTFLIVTLCITAFIAIITVYDGLFILGENQIIYPWIAMWIIPSVIVLGSTRKFIKL